MISSGSFEVEFLSCWNLIVGTERGYFVLLTWEIPKSFIILVQFTAGLEVLKVSSELDGSVTI